MNNKKYGITIYPERDKEFSKEGLKLLSKYYSEDKGQTAQEVLAKAANNFCYGDTELAQRLYDACSKRWFFFSSPPLSNAVEGQWDSNVDYNSPEFWKPENKELRKAAWLGSTPKAAPISCYLTRVEDNLDSQLKASQEIKKLSIMGGGTSIQTTIRSSTEKAPGPIPFFKTVDGDMGYWRQGKNRRGSCAIYMDVNHPDIIEFIKMRTPSGGDANRKILNRKGVHHGVNFTKEFAKAVLEDLDFDLVCPHTKEVKQTVKARYIWETFLETREMTGEPYLWNIDNVNAALPQSQKDLGLRNYGSNLCVTGETVVLTRKGEVPIKELVDKEVEIWNSKEWSKVTVKKTGTNQETLFISLNNRLKGNDLEFLECTPYHKFYVKGKGEVRANALEVNDILDYQTFPEGFNPKEWRIVKIEKGYCLKDTYCFTEPKLGLGTFNGIVTGNCSEISLPNNSERTAVCCLSSLNLEKYDEWKDTTLVQDLTTLLDNVIQWFIDWADEDLSRAAFSAEKERAIGIGGMGWANYLMKHSIPFESGGFNSAVQHNNIIWKNIKDKAAKQSRYLASVRGEPDDMKGTGLRNSHLLSIAPNANSSILCNTSPSIEPLMSNAYTQKTRAGIMMVKNSYLEPILEKYGINTPETWTSIIKNSGSVQHLEELSLHEKQVFKTAWEIDMHWVVQHAEDRQKYICQAQSLNLFFLPGSSREYINSVHLKILFSPILKSAYYMRSGSELKADYVKNVERVSLKDWSEGNDEDCVSCQG